MLTHIHRSLGADALVDETYSATDSAPITWVVSHDFTLAANPGKTCQWGVLRAPEDAGGYYRTALPRTSTGDELMTIGDWVKRLEPECSKSQRIALAFRLGLAVLQFAKTPLARNLRKPTDWLVAIHSASRSSPPVFLLWSRPLDMVPVAVSGQPLLTNLGITLGELALGRTLCDYRDKDPDFLGAQGAGHVSSEVQDVLTIRRLISLGHIARAVSSDFESVVTACVMHQFRDHRDGRVKELDSGDPLFLELASLAILIPLYHEARRHMG